MTDTKPNNKVYGPAGSAAGKTAASGTGGAIICMWVLEHLGIDPSEFTASRVAALTGIFAGVATLIIEIARRRYNGR